MSFDDVEKASPELQPKDFINLEDHRAKDDALDEDDHFGNVSSNSGDGNQPLLKFGLPLARRVVNDEGNYEQTVAVFRGRNDSDLGESQLRKSYDRLFLDQDDQGGSDLPSSSTPRHNFSKFNERARKFCVKDSMYWCLQLLLTAVSFCSNQSL